jgi:hypothetical protein
MQTPNEDNPEFEMYRQVLLRERRSEYVQGWRLTILGAGLALLLIGLFLLSFQQIVARGPLYLSILLLILVGSLGAFGLGLASLRTAAKLPTMREVAHIRRFSRSRLLQQAQGKLPWSYRRSGRIVLTSAGVFFVALAAFVLSVSGFQAWDGWIEGVGGFLLVFYALIIIPYARRRLPVESADLLAKTLVAGEETEGVPIEQEER